MRGRSDETSSNAIGDRAIRYCFPGRFATLLRIDLSTREKLATAPTISHVRDMNVEQRREPRTRFERKSPRQAFVPEAEPVFANKFIEGLPYAVEVLDASPTGFRVRCIVEPTSTKETFALELCLDGKRFFTWARRVRREGDHEAYRILAIDPIDRALLQKSLRAMPQA